MLVRWHSQGGLAYVTDVYDRATQCFRQYGSSRNTEGEGAIRIDEFKEALKMLHGIEEEESGSNLLMVIA